MFKMKKPHIYREQDDASYWSWAVKPGWFWLWNHQAFKFVTRMNWGWQPGRRWR